MMMSGINPVDTYVREGAFLVLPELPYVPGYDGAGVVESVGKLVTKLKVISKFSFRQITDLPGFLALPDIGNILIQR